MESRGPEERPLQLAVLCSSGSGWDSALGICWDQFWPWKWNCWPLSCVPCFAIPWTARLFGLWDFPGKNTGAGCCFLLQGIFLTQESDLGLLHYRQILYRLSHQIRSDTYLGSDNPAGKLSLSRSSCCSRCLLGCETSPGPGSRAGDESTAGRLPTPRWPLPLLGGGRSSLLRVWAVETDLFLSPACQKPP